MSVCEEKYKTKSGGIATKGKGEHTVVASKDEVIHGLQTEQGQKVPRQTGHPPHVQVACSYTRLKH